jgi:WD40 repeat protein
VVSFDGFISYSHAADGQLAPAVQRGLHRLAKPWHRRRALWIFRDQTGLSVTPALWSSIQKALDGSEFFVLLASPEAARSPWVNREVEHWLATKSTDRILPVVTDGTWEWDPAAQDFTGDSTAVPEALRGVFTEEPLYLDLRWARHDQHLTLRHSRFRDAIAQLAAPMHGVSKDELEGEDVRQHRRAGRLRVAAVALLLGSTVLASVAGALAMRNAAAATASAQEALRQQRVAAEQRGSAEHFAGEARRQEDVARRQLELAKTAGAEAERQEELAERQKGLADQASAEATRQLGNAARAAARARQQERLARRQGALAAESAQQARRQERRAKEQEHLTRRQERLAAEAAADAQRQHQLAEQQERRADEQERRADEQEQRAKAAGEDAARQKENADRQEGIAISRRLVTVAKETLPDDPRTAVRLGAAAQQINPDAETRREVAGIVNANRKAGSLPDAAEIVSGQDGPVATVNSDGTVSLWNLTDRSRPVKVTTIGRRGHPENVRVALSPDGKAVAVSLGGGERVQLWNVTDRARPTLAKTLVGDPFGAEVWYREVAFSPDGQVLVTRGGRGFDDPTGYGTLWDVSDLTRPTEISALRDPRGNDGDLLQFSADGRTLVVGAHVWDVTNRTKPVIRSVLDFSARADVNAQALSPAGPPVLAVGFVTGALHLYNLADAAKPVRTTRLTADVGEILSLDFSSDGRLLASGDTDGRARVYELGKYSPRPLGTVPGNSGVSSVAFSPDDRTLVTTDTSETAALWNVTEFAAPGHLAHVAAHDKYLLDLVFGPDGRSITTLGHDDPATFWDLTDRKNPVRRATVPVAGGVPVISPDGRTVAADDGRVVTLTDVTHPARPSALATFRPRGSDFQATAFSPDGRTLLISSGGDELELWDLTRRNAPTWLATIAEDAGLTAVSPDGRTLAVTDGGKVSIYDLADRSAPKMIYTLAGHGNTVTSLAFSPDSSTVATGSYDQTTILWNVAGRAQPQRLGTLRGTGAVRAVAFSRDGETVATATTTSRGLVWDSWATVWDVARLTKPVRIATLRLADDADPVAMAFSPDGATLAVGENVGLGGAGPRKDTSHDFELWDLTEVHALRANPARVACAVAGGGLTVEEWSRYLPEIPYRRTCSG